MVQQDIDKQDITLKQALLGFLNRVFVGDKVIWFILFLLIFVSLLAIYSSTVSLSYIKNDGNFNYYLINQVVIIMFGFVGLAVIRFIPIKIYYDWAKLFFILVVLLMLYTIFFGVELNGARRWVRIGAFTIQSSDFLKVGLFVYLCRVMWDMRVKINEINFIPIAKIFKFKQNKQEILYTLKTYTLPLFFPLAIACGLIMPENLSTCLVLGLISMVLYYIGNVNKKELFKIIFLVVLFLSILVSIMAITGIGRYETWKGRFVQFIGGGIEMVDDKGNVIDVNSLNINDFQRVQSDIAIANGWLGGKGLGESVQRSNLPNSYSDFIFSFIVEEWGLARSILVMLLYCWLFFRTIKIAQKCEDGFAALLCVSFGLLFSGSALFHMAVCVGLFPVTGLTLPLISHGGSSIIFSFMLISVILKISYEQEKREKQKLAESQVDEIEIN